MHGQEFLLFSFWSRRTSVGSVSPGRRRFDDIKRAAIWFGASVCELKTGILRGRDGKSESRNLPWDPVAVITLEFGEILTTASNIRSSPASSCFARIGGQGQGRAMLVDVVGQYLVNDKTCNDPYPATS